MSLAGISLLSKAAAGFCQGPEPLSSTVERQTDADVAIEQRIVSDRNLACSVLIGHETLSDRELKVCLLP